MAARVFIFAESFNKQWSLEQMSVPRLTYTAALLYAILYVSVKTSAAATPESSGQGANATSTPPPPGDNAGSGEGSGEEEEEEEYCPGYRTGRPSPTELESCATGVDIGVVDHMQAFGINPNFASTNWTACGIRFLPNENERVCYKTTVLSCQDDYRIYLNRRNLRTLQSNCPSESDRVPACTQGGVFLQSPRYGCTKTNQSGRRNQFNYRKSEFCLYNISLPECESGEVVIDNRLHFTQEMEIRQRNHICSDYLQFFAPHVTSKRYCDSELARLVLRLPTTHFTALFWTDTTENKMGFKLRVTCADNNA